MEKTVHPNYIKSSELAFISAGLGIINLSLSPVVFSNSIAIITAILTLIFVFGLAYLIRFGFSWVKYLLLALFIIGIFGIPIIIKNLYENPIVGIINLVQTVLQIGSIVLLFKIPKAKNSSKL